MVRVEPWAQVHDYSTFGGAGRVRWQDEPPRHWHAAKRTLAQ